MQICSSGTAAPPSGIVAPRHRAADVRAVMRLIGIPVARGRQVLAGNPVARQILVRGLSGGVQLSPGGGLVQQGSNAGGVTRTTLALGYRFMLSSAAQAGTYAWPMQLSVTPL